MSNVWLTSDWHFGHLGICQGTSHWEDKSNCRDFNTIEEHDSYILNELNKRVKSQDVLYFLGDFGMGLALKDRIIPIREKINCKIIYCNPGNHDKLFIGQNRTKYPEISAIFKDIKDFFYKKICGRLLVTCHYAMLTWPWQHHGAIMLYGHSHGSLPDNPHSLSMDIGIDTCLFGHEKYTPYSIEEIFHIMDTYKKFVPIDHHKDKSVNPC